MSRAALSGSDSAIINQRVFNDLADGDWATLTFPTDVASVKTGKNGNSLYALNNTGLQVDLTLRLIRGSPDDKFLNNLYSQMVAGFAAFVLLNGQFVKQIGDGAGNVLKDTYIASGGVFVRGIDAKGNSDGDVDQSVSVWKMKFTNSPRAMT